MVVRWPQGARGIFGQRPDTVEPRLSGGVGRYSEEPVELGPGHCIAYPGDVRIRDTLEPGSTVVMVFEHVQEGVQNAAPVSGPDRCPRAG